MQKKASFTLFTLNEFDEWLQAQLQLRIIKLVQNHHTYIGLRQLQVEQSFSLLESMEASHIRRGFNAIAQNLTTFPDGTWHMPAHDVAAGIKGANSAASASSMSATGKTATR